MNILGTASEWVNLSLFQLTSSDRLFFLPNFFSFVLLPGLIFGVFKECGVPGRVARIWMWILPCAYGFALQAGSIGNDLFGSVFVLASLYFALRYRRTASKSDLLFALLSASVMTGVKATNLPLLLPVATALFAARRTLLKHWGIATLALALGLLSSLLPTALLNQHFTGHWSGDPRNTTQANITAPVAGVLGNTIQIVSQSILPPILPGSSKLEQKFAEMLPHSATARLKEGFPRFKIDLGELPREESAGLGLGISALIVIAIIWIATHPRGVYPVSNRKRIGYAISAGAWCAFLVYLCKAGSEASARLILPYYPLLLIPVLLNQSIVSLQNTRWWQKTAFVCAAMTLIPVILSPARPLWPALTVIRELRERSPANPSLRRAEEVYFTYRERNDALRSLRERLEPNARMVALVAGEDDSEVALWRPFGHRRVLHLLGNASWEQETRGFDWIVGRTELLQPLFQKNLELIQKEGSFAVIAEEDVTVKASIGAESWFVLKRVGQPQPDHRTALPENRYISPR